MPNSSTKDCMTIAAAFHPAGRDSAKGNTMKELRLPRENASVRPCSAGNRFRLVPVVKVER